MGIRRRAYSEIVESKRKAKSKRGTVGEGGPGKVRDGYSDKLDMIRETIVFVPSVDCHNDNRRAVHTLYPSLVNACAWRLCLVGRGRADAH